ncbi:MAG: hypothetical protein ACO3YS_06595 [Burkholderiaceae bacterium]
MPTAQPMGFSHFLSQTDALGLVLFVILIAMSVASWTVIVTKIRQAMGRKKKRRRLSRSFRRSAA